MVYRLKKTKKIFCIGFNKTGTTSIRKFLEDHKYKIGDQSIAESLLSDYTKRNWKPLINYVKSADAFQDIPFSLPFTYIILDKIYPEAYFILTVRSNETIWYNSLLSFHRKMFGKGKIPSAVQLKNSTYREKGFIYNYIKIVFNTPDDNLYDANRLKKAYLRHNENVREYFQFKNNFMEIDVSEPQAAMKLSHFMNLRVKYSEMPWENRTLLK